MRHQDETKHEFLLALAHDGRFNAAARAVGLHPVTVRRWIKDDPAFAEGVETARLDLTERLEESAIERAVEGVLEERFDKDGNLIGRKRVYSDGLLTLLLKANAPDKYKDRSSTEIGNMPGETFDVSDTAKAARAAAILEAARQRRDNPEDEVDPFQ